MNNASPPAAHRDVPSGYDATERAQAARRLLEALDGHEAGRVSLRALRLRAAKYKRLLGGGPRRAHHACIRDMNAAKPGWLDGMHGNTRYLESHGRREFARREQRADRP